MDNCSEILSKLNNITDDNVLIIKCNTVAQQLAIDTLVKDKRYSTIPISCDNWKENFIAYNGLGWYLSFGNLEWRSDEDPNYDYYVYGHDGYEEIILYHHDKNKRLLDFCRHNDIADLEYNAIVIFPNYLKMKYTKLDEFIKRKNSVWKRDCSKINEPIDINNQFKYIINNIHEFDTSLCSRHDILECYDIRKVLLLKEISGNNLNVEDIFVLICNVYYSCNNM
jgi:hypothetical protein